MSWCVQTRMHPTAEIQQIISLEYIRQQVKVINAAREREFVNNELKKGGKDE